MSDERAALTGDGRWHVRVWTLAGPVILSNMSVPLAGAVDTAVVGRLPDPAHIGAVALGALVFNFLYWMFSFLRMATTGFAAQALGAGDVAGLQASALRALLAATVLGALLVVLQTPVAAIAVAVLDGSAAVEAGMLEYYHVRIWAAPAGLLNFAVLGVLFGMQRMGTALVLQVLLNVINVVLDLVLVLGLDAGVTGVAVATLTAEWAAAILGMVLVLRIMRRLGPWPDRRTVLDRQQLLALGRANLNIMVRTVAALSAIAHFTSAGARLGDVVLAANAILLHLQTIMAFGLDGFAHAVEALAGNAWGARNARALRTAVRVATGWAAAVGAVYAIVYWLAGPSIIALMTTIDAVRDTALDYLPWMIASPLLSVWSFMLDGVFIGLTRSREMRDTMVLSLAVYLLAATLAAPVLGNHGLWLALTVFMVARAVTLGWCYRREVPFPV